MREIKFRIWCEHENVMYPDHNLYKDGEGLIEEGDILLQYTGLKDKNGKEIYEGDIVIFERHNRQVLFDKGCFVTTRQNKEPFAYKELWEIYSICEVIGNIYENPNLLKVKDQQ